MIPEPEWLQDFQEELRSLALILEWSKAEDCFGVN